MAQHASRKLVESVSLYEPKRLTPCGCNVAHTRVHTHTQEDPAIDSNVHYVKYRILPIFHETQ